MKRTVARAILWTLTALLVVTIVGTIPLAIVLGVPEALLVWLVVPLIAILWWATETAWDEVEKPREWGEVPVDDASHFPPEGEIEILPPGEDGRGHRFKRR